MSESGERPVGVALAGLLLGGEKGVEVCWGVFAVPVIAEEPDPVPGDGCCPSSGEGRLDLGWFVSSDGFEAEPVGVVAGVESGQGGGPVPSHTGAHGDPGTVAGQDRHQPTGAGGTDKR